jgi:hypothetical protein
MDPPVKAERAAALARDATQALRNSRRLTEDDIRALITALGDLRDVLRDAGTTEKTAIYDQLGLKVTFRPGEAKIRAEVTFGPENYAEHAEQCGIWVVSEGAARKLPAGVRRQAGIRVLSVTRAQRRWRVSA